MNDEIKEKIYKLRAYLGTEENWLLNDIADYITNLQQKVEQYENPDDLTLFYMWLDEKAKDKMKELQQRIDKAIEYIYDFSLADSIILKRSYKDLLNILQGDSDE